MAGAFKPWIYEMEGALVSWIYELTGALELWIVKDDYLALVSKKEMAGAVGP